MPLSPQGRTNKGQALDRKRGTRTLVIDWVAEFHTIDSRGELLAYRSLTKQKIYITESILINHNTQTITKKKSENNRETIPSTTTIL